MFLKGCLCTVLEIFGSLNAEITVCVFYASVVPYTKTSANKNWEEREGGNEGKLTEQQHSQSSSSSISTSRIPGHWLCPQVLDVSTTLPKP